MYYLGVDYHKRFSYLTAKDEAGRVLQARKVPNDPVLLEKFLEGLEGPGKATLEAGRNWLWMYDFLVPRMEKVIPAHALRVKAIASARIKTDAIDSGILADLLRADLIPPAHAPSPEARVARDVFRQRVFMVRMRTRVKNRIHAVVDRYPELRAGIEEPTDQFGKAGRAWLKELKLPEVERRLLDREMEVLEFLDSQVRKSDAWVREVASKHPEVELLKSLPGIGTFFAVLIWAELDGIERFPDAPHLAAYAGLVPSTYASGGRVAHGAITKQGDRWLRWAMVEAIMPAMRVDPWLRAKYDQVKRRKGSNTAKVATARRLLDLVYRVLKEKRPYRPGVIRTPLDQAA